MKRIQILTLTSLIAAANLTAGFALGEASPASDALPAASPADTAQYTAAPVASAEDSGEGYLLLDVNGHVCIYEGSSLLLKTDIEVASLPASDREALSAGIRAETAQELASYLEDFGS